MQHLHGPASALMECNSTAKAGSWAVLVWAWLKRLEGSGGLSLWEGMGQLRCSCLASQQPEVSDPPHGMGKCPLLLNNPLCIPPSASSLRLQPWGSKGKAGVGSAEKSDKSGKENWKKTLFFSQLKKTKKQRKKRRRSKKWKEQGEKLVIGKLIWKSGLLESGGNCFQKENYCKILHEKDFTLLDKKCSWGKGRAGGSGNWFWL